MRPNVDVPSSDQYECVACGNRTSLDGDRECPECGGSLRNLTLSRDL